MTTLINSLEAVVLFIVVLGVLVLFHELGHYVTARLAGIRVPEFGFGFPPRAKVLGVWHDTEWTLNWLPIGGFVKLEDEDGADDPGPRSFASARLPKKLVILLAGVVMNVVLALVIFTGIAWLATPYVGVRFGTVEAGSPAAAAGLKNGEALVSLDGQRFDFFAPYLGGTILQAIRADAGQTVTLGVLHADGTTSEVAVTLRSPSQVDDSHGTLGVRAADPTLGFETVFLPGTTGHSLGDAVRIGWSETWRWFGLILGGLADLGRSIVTNPTGAPAVSGPIGIATSLGSIFRDSGPIMTLYFMGMLSANLALFNALPFPPLDGGRMLVIALKAIPRYGTKISTRAERLTYAIGFLAMFAFFIWVTVFDVIRGVTGS